MGKKTKPPPAPSSAVNDAEPGPGSNNFFKKLFGDVPKGGDSIFSDDNPFRRKNNESLHQGQLVQPDDAAADGKLDVKGKRKMAKKEISDDLSTEEPPGSSLKIKKLKKEKARGEDGEREEEESESERKKRKRDAVEKEYEKRLFGAVEEGNEKQKKKRDEVEKEYEYEKRVFGAVKKEKARGDTTTRRRKDIGFYLHKTSVLNRCLFLRCHKSGEKTSVIRKPMS